MRSILQASLFIALIAPLFASVSASAQGLTTSAPTESVVPDSPRPQPSGPLTLGERFHQEVHTTLGPSAFLLPAADALVDMADPPHRYPREWRDGGGAFGRNYGAEFARNTTAGFTHFAVAAIDHEDPRYYPSQNRNVAKRTIHALAFTVVDRNMSGHRTLAVSNLTGAAAGGFVGMAFYPDGFDDVTHAYQRGAFQTTAFATHNLIEEFSPEIIRLMRKMHLPEGLSNSLLPYDVRRKN